MRFQYSHGRRLFFFFAPEHGVSTVSGGGRPLADSPPASEAIDDAFAEDARGHGNTPGFGVAGSNSNPVLTHDGITERAHRIWQEEGPPDRRADEHWHRAESELREDKLAEQVKATFFTSPSFEFPDVQVAAFKGTVQLSGFVCPTIKSNPPRSSPKVCPGFSLWRIGFRSSASS